MTRISINDLAAPDRDALIHSHQLRCRIEEDIKKAGGNIGFDEFMDHALYEPSLGYYSAGAEKIGKAGDYITAPELSGLFSRSLARHVVHVLDKLPEKTVLEVGPGTGSMAVELLSELERLDSLPDSYLLLETSADLRERQQRHLEDKLPGLSSRLHWLDSLPENMLSGVIIGNEVLDAMPVFRVQFNKGRFTELAVGLEDNEFTWCQRPLTGIKDKLVRRSLDGLETALTEGYITELNPGLDSWIRSVANILSQGEMLLIDYGYTRAEYYHPQRNEGTLLCHYRHHVHDNPFLYPGLQDITASVDFTAVAEAAVNAGLQVQGYTTQAHFLIDCGMAEIMRENIHGDIIGELEMSHQARLLTLPGEMGERFKVIALARGMTFPLTGFRQHDQRHRL